MDGRFFLEDGERSNCTELLLFWKPFSSESRKNSLASVSRTS